MTGGRNLYIRRILQKGICFENIIGEGLYFEEFVKVYKYISIDL